MARWHYNNDWRLDMKGFSPSPPLTNTQHTRVCIPIKRRQGRSKRKPIIICVTCSGGKLSSTHTHTHTTHCRNTQGLYGQAKYVYLTCNPITQEAKHRQNIWKSKYIETHFVYVIRNIRTPRTQDWSHAIKTTTPGNELISYYDDDDAASSYFTWFN